MKSLTYQHTMRDGRVIEMRAHADGMKQLLGLGYKAKLPREGMAPRVIQGVKVWVEPAKPQRTVERWGKLYMMKSSAHRVMAECPHCGQHLSAGRLHQHKCKTNTTKEN